MLDARRKAFSLFVNILATFCCFKKINRLASRRKNKILGIWLPAAFTAKIHISNIVSTGLTPAAPVLQL
jgi:hypothetical protein